MLAQLKSQRHHGSTWRTGKTLWTEKVHLGGYRVIYIEVGDRPSWIDGTCDHLKNLVGSDACAHARK